MGRKRRNLLSVVQGQGGVGGGGLPNYEIADKVRASRPTVSLWRAGMPSRGGHYSSVHAF